MAVESEHIGYVSDNGGIYKTGIYNHRNQLMLTSEHTAKKNG